MNCAPLAIAHNSRMGNSRLELRSDGRLGLAYAVAPLFAAGAAWITMTVLPGDFSLVRSLFLLPWVMLYGSILIGIAELIFVTPFVWAFQRYRWNWLSGWSACLLALAIGTLLGFSIGSIEVVPHVPPKLPERLGCALIFALPAVVVALTFRLIAFRETGPKTL